jgi:hypothetical protein
MGTICTTPERPHKLIQIIESVFQCTAALGSGASPPEHRRAAIEAIIDD